MVEERCSLLCVGYISELFLWTGRRRAFRCAEWGWHVLPAYRSPFEDKQVLIRVHSKLEQSRNIDWRNSNPSAAILCILGRWMWAKTQAAMNLTRMQTLIMMLLLHRMILFRVLLIFAMSANDAVNDPLMQRSDQGKGLYIEATNVAGQHLTTGCQVCAVCDNS